MEEGGGAVVVVLLREGARMACCCEGRKRAMTTTKDFIRLFLHVSLFSSLPPDFVRAELLSREKSEKAALFSIAPPPSTPLRRHTHAATAERRRSEVSLVLRVRAAD